MDDEHAPRSRWLGSRWKRAVDVVGASLGLIVALPILLVCVVLVMASSKGGPFFRQRRAGLEGREFDVLKLRTMTRSSVGPWDPATDSARLTRVGRTLRKLSLDELPQLWNVLVGQMSLVGPRPLPVLYVARYDSMQRRRLEARPGLTGLAQVRGRNDLTWSEKFRWDVDYVVGATVWMDLAILASTVRIVLRPSGVSAEGHATMPEFTGDGA